MKHYLDVFRKYAVMRGRATRKDLWMFILFNIIVSFLIVVVEILLDMAPTDGSIGLLSYLYTLALICPTLCLYTRRLHDVNKSGWWQLLIVVPFANLYLFYLEFLKAGTPGINKYGAPSGNADAYEAASAVPMANEFSGYEMCPAPQPSQRKYCAYCGSELADGAKFCSECGAPVNK